MKYYFEKNLDLYLDDTFERLKKFFKQSKNL